MAGAAPPMAGGLADLEKAGVTRQSDVALSCVAHDGAAEAVATVELVLDGDVLDCHLCEVHLAELRTTFADWSSHARPAGGSGGNGAATSPQGRRQKISESSGRTGSRPKRKVTQPQRMSIARPARRVPVQPRAEERRERILVASEEVFAEMGYEATNTNLIAARAETSVGSVYNLLGSKESIAIALFDRYLDELQRHYDQVVRSAPDLHALVDLVELFVEARPAMRPLLRNRWGSDDLRAARRRVEASLAIPLERLIARQRALADPIRRRIVAEMCAGMIWRMIDEVADLPPERRPARVAELKLLLVGYVVAGVAAA
jgi:AcrR family transcriptional regulator